MKKEIELVWNVYNLRWNNELEIFNVFDHRSFNERIQKLLQKPPTKEEFAEQLRREAQYRYWAKCEWELIISDLHTQVDQRELNRILSECYLERSKADPPLRCTHVNLYHDEKIDIYDQLCLNWDAFVDYVWEHRKITRKRVQK